MPPTTIGTSLRRSLAALDSCSGPCTLSLLIGCAIPIVCVTSTFIFIWAKRRSRIRVAVQENVVPTHRSSFGMIYSRLSSISMNRRSTLTPSIDPNLIPSSASRKSSVVSLNRTSETPTRVSLRNSTPTHRAPLLDTCIPALPSILGEFLLYSDVITSTSDVETLPYQTPSSMPTQRYPVSPISIKPPTPPKTDAARSSPISTIRSSTPQSLSVVIQEDDSNDTLEKGNGPRKDDPFESMDVEELSLYLTADTQLVDQPLLSKNENRNPAPIASMWSILATSTIDTLTTVRLDDFPPVPSSISMSGSTPMWKAIPSSSISLLSLVKAWTPASLHLLDVKFDHSDKKFSCKHHCLAGPQLLSEPGQLWDDEDERRFSYPYRRHATRPSMEHMRKTWTAGMLYSRSCGPGDLWDENDELLISQVSANSSTSMSTLASISYVSLEFSMSDSDLDRTLSTDFHAFYSGMEDANDSAKGHNIDAESDNTQSRKCPQLVHPLRQLCICREIFHTVSSDCSCGADGCSVGTRKILKSADDVLLLSDVEVRFATP